ncbi:hypothetical protein L873DRAFT_1788901 [Choiromyces venosus 120613-1]|uniref:DUF4219 domain-containing protein n=1 Tax=Choiromyces venosus 120613-1 TaxID=1336337 RepID=A0A3N4JWJ9_9PEZI|nr:hypothetical protein L873DRAFT_1788901 [Choiromyces venosus 120613-1]
MATTTISFEKLTESNFLKWIVRMKSTLQRDGVWRIVTREEVKPTPATSDDDDTTRRAIELTSNTSSGSLCPDKNSSYSHEDVYFISNGLRRQTSASVSFRVASGVPELWDAETAAGLGLGTNGLFVAESSTRNPASALEVEKALSEWAHIALVYSGNTPSICINSEVSTVGKKSSFIVHPGTRTPDGTNMMMNRFEGDVESLETHSTALSAFSVSKLFASGIPTPTAPAVSVVGGNVVFRQN